MNTSALPVLVGVTGRGENTAALRFALAEVMRDRGEICLLRAVHDTVPPPPPSVVLTLPVDWERVARQVLHDVEDELTELAGGVVPSTLLARQGRPADVLVDEGRFARLVVLQHRRLSALRRVFTGSTVAGVAAHAHCPVVSVPPGWVPSTTPARVAVGVHQDGEPPAVLEEAFAQAAARRASLRVLHAWVHDAVYDPFMLADVNEELTASLQQRLEERVALLREKYPDVPVQVTVQHRWPPDALVELSTTSDLLVVGRHGRHAPLPHTLGSMARAVLNAAECPVLVVPSE